MSATLLDGKALAERLESELARRVGQWVAAGHRPPCLAVVLVGEDPASRVYVRRKQQACQRAGMESRLHRLPAETDTAQLLQRLAELGADPAVDGILVQLPLPAAIDQRAVLDAVPPHKDVDCFHPENVGLMAQGRPRFVPCTPRGILALLSAYDIETAGKNAVVVGRSEIVGKPMALLLLQRGADATVTVCHSRTRDLAEQTRRADLLVVAAGRPQMITGDMVRPGAVVVDVGIHRTAAGTLVGDVDFSSVAPRASHLTPVPGGVGPLTVAMLLENCLTAAQGGRPG